MSGMKVRVGGVWEDWATAAAAGHPIDMGVGWPATNIPAYAANLGPDVLDTYPPRFVGPNASYAFHGMKALTSVPALNTSNVTDLVNTFYGCTSLTSVPAFNTANVTNMNAMFSGCTSLTSVPAFNTANVTNMSYMFYNCSKLTSVPAFNTANVTNINSMFSGCSSLTYVPALDASKPTSLNYMFSGCTSLTSVGVYGFRYSLSVQNTQLDASALNTLFTNAGTAYNSSQIITVTGTPGAATCDPSIATAKGWKVKTV